MMIRDVHPPRTRNELLRAVAMLLQDAFFDCCATVGWQDDGIAIAFEHQVEPEIEGDLVLMLMDRDAWMGYRDSLEGKTDQGDDDEPLSFRIGVN